LEIICSAQDEACDVAGDALEIIDLGCGTQTWLGRSKQMYVMQVGEGIDCSPVRPVSVCTTSLGFSLLSFKGQFSVSYL
jgi:hypothetical protein